MTKISGIGPVYAEELHKLGFTSFKQIAELTEEQITDIAEKVDGISEDSIKNEEWIKQAKDLMK
ncbi:MAG: helix-hairpin-helix domain-containing protein [Cyclobacteriaceae bacterium]